MPIYEYKCKNCSHVFDAFQKIGEDGSKLECPECGVAEPEKLISSFASSGADYYSGSSASNNCSSGFG